MLQPCTVALESVPGRLEAGIGIHYFASLYTGRRKKMRKQLYFGYIDEDDKGPK